MPHRCCASGAQSFTAAALRVLNCLPLLRSARSPQFPCGSHGIYKYEEESCCEQGRPFDTAAEYCCTGSGQHGLHSYNDGKCDLTCPDGCQCYNSIAAAISTSDEDVTTVLELPKAGMGDSLVDTSTPPEGGYLCHSSTGPSTGCMNGWPYNYSTHAPCGTWLMEFGTYGCCPGGDSGGFLPYPMGTLYCCKIEGAEPGKDYALKSSSCQCHRYGC